MEPEGSIPHSQEPATILPFRLQNQINPLLSVPTASLNTHVAIILFSTLISSKWSLSFGVSHHYSIHISPVPIAVF